MKRTGAVVNPFQMIALKQKIGAEDANNFAFPILVYLDAAKRGQGFIMAENALVRWIAMAQVIGSKSGNRAFYNLAVEAGGALFKACGRGEELLALTTGEYAALKKLMAAYLRILPDMQVKLFVFAANRAEELIAKMQSEDR